METDRGMGEAGPSEGGPRRGGIRDWQLIEILNAQMNIWKLQ